MKSKAHSFMKCNSPNCKCVDNKCRFYSSYAEGSLYDGYVVSDQIYVGDNPSYESDAFTYTFGCVKKETHYFFT